MKAEKYKEANHPDLKANEFVSGHSVCRFVGLADDTIRFIENTQLVDVILWKRFVVQFRIHSDSEDAAWRGEYWGKMMRGACFVYSYTRDKELYDILTETVSEMLKSSDADGRLSTYEREKELTGWDLWCRKYVLLGMQYYLEICEDDVFAEAVVENLCKQADYIMQKIGPREEGKLPITEASAAYRGLNSSSILEPFVRLYNITKEGKYFAFSEYIVNEGGTSIGNIFQLAYEDQFYPYQYPMTKAYEMVSCFEGLLEYYRVTGEMWQKEALVRFADKLIESDFTVIGSSGCTCELLDHSTVRQANTNNREIMQETCVTVTLMKFFYQMTLLTGDAKYADAFEVSYYNAYLGAINTEGSIDSTLGELAPHAVVEPMPFDSYSPLSAGVRGNGIGGFNVMSDNHYYGCCACIGSVGAGLFPKMAVMQAKDGIVVNLYNSGVIEAQTPSGNQIVLQVETGYPIDGTIKMNVVSQIEESFAFYLRNPVWSKQTFVKVNGKEYPSKTGYIRLEQVWKTGDEIELVLDMRTEVIRPISYGQQILMTGFIGRLDYTIPMYDVEDPKAKHNRAFRRGPLTLALDGELGYDVEQVWPIEISDDGYVEASLSQCDMPYKRLLVLDVPLKNNSSVILTDYASAGKKWNKKMAAWIAIESEL